MSRNKQRLLFAIPVVMFLASTLPAIWMDPCDTITQAQPKILYACSRAVGDSIRAQLKEQMVVAVLLHPAACGQEGNPLSAIILCRFLAQQCRTNYYSIALAGHKLD
jgi:hypothetical protein